MKGTIVPPPVRCARAQQQSFAFISLAILTYLTYSRLQPSGPQFRGACSRQRRFTSQAKKRWEQLGSNKMVQNARLNSSDIAAQLEKLIVLFGIRILENYRCSLERCTRDLFACSANIREPNLTEMEKQEIPFSEVSNYQRQFRLPVRHHGVYKNGMGHLSTKPFWGFQPISAVQCNDGQKMPKVCYAVCILTVQYRCFC